MQPETRFKLKVKKALSLLPNTWHFKTQMVAALGVPDIIGVSKGRFFAWELKVGTNRVTNLQEYVLNKIKEAGGIAREVRPENLEEALNELKALP